MKKLSLLFVLTLLLAACGSGGDSSEPKNTNAEETSQEESKKEKDSNESNDDAKFYADALKEEVPYLTDEQGTLSQESYDFIVSNPGLLPAKEDKSIAKAKSSAEKVDLKVLNKNINPYYSKLVSFEGYVVQVEEESFENGETAAWVNVYDESNDANHSVYIYKSTGDILEEDQIQFWAIPITKYSYETLDGGYQNTILFFAAHVEKK